MSIQFDSTSLRIARDATRLLTIQEKAQLISELAQEIAQMKPPASTVVPLHDGLARFKAFTADFRVAHPTADVTGRLDADRRERDASLIGELPDVHS
jgi:hypothetical protein